MARIEDMKSIDEQLLQAMLKENGGQPPNYFIDDAQGGGVSAELLANQDPAQEQEMIDALDRELVRLKPGLAALLLDDEMPEGKVSPTPES